MKKVIGIILLVIFFSMGTANAAVFTKNLYFGLENDSEILKLQEFLTTEGLYSGPITGNFYSLTLNGVKAFQAKHSITPVGGFFGPLTRGKANTIIDSQLSNSESQAITETGSASPTPQIKTDTTQLQLSALLAQLELLQKQLNAQQQTIQGTQNVQTNTIPAQESTPIVLPNNPQTTQTPSTPQTTPSLTYFCILYRIANGDDPSIHKYASIVLNKEFTTTAERDEWVIGKWNGSDFNPGWKPLIEAANDPNYDGRYGSVSGWWGKGYDCYEK